MGAAHSFKVAEYVRNTRLRGYADARKRLRARTFRREGGNFLTPPPPIHSGRVEVRPERHARWVAFVALFDEVSERNDFEHVLAVQLDHCRYHWVDSASGSLSHVLDVYLNAAPCIRVLFLRFQHVEHAHGLAPL